MDKDKIDILLRELQKETIKNDKEVESEEQKARLIEIAKMYNGEDKVVSFASLEKEIKESPPIKKMSCSIEGLDKLLSGGFMTQTVTVISATPKSGKTSFCMHLTTKLMNYNPMWLALEESAKSLIRKMIKYGNPVPKGYSPASNAPIVSLEWVESKIVESFAKYGTKVVFIDQLDFIVPQDSSGDRHDLKIAQTMRVLHQIAVRLDVAIFLVCHLEKMEPDTKPTTKNLRGSSAIWGEADNCIFLWRECKRLKGELEYSNNILVSLQANREDGDTGNIKMIYDKGNFIESEWSSDEEEAKKDFKKF